MAKFLMNLFSIPIMVGLSILVNINGWGLTPINWWWIIGVGAVGNMIIVTTLVIGNKD